MRLILIAAVLGLAMQSARAQSNVSMAEEKSVLDRISINYFAILYGPSVAKPTSYQPDPMGRPNRDAPVFFRNFLGVGYGLTEEVSITPTAQWAYQPVMGQQMIMEDPFVRLSDISLFSSGPWNLYADIQTIFGVSKGSRQADLLGGAKSFQALTYVIDEGTIVLGLRSYARYNIFGRQGSGVDLELYLAPSFLYQLTDQFALTMLYEMGASHSFGAKAFQMANDGTDFQPGVSWDINQNLSFNPYLNLYPGGKVNFRSISFGMTLAWKLV